MKNKWTTSDICKIFRLTDSSKTPLIYAEEKGEIPKAARSARGNSRIMVREWTSAQLPTIGNKFGFLKPPPHQLIICMYTPKGGVIKTTFTANLARILAINGIKTLAIGLDFQLSLTKYILQNSIELSEKGGSNIPKVGLYHLLYEGAELADVLQHTDLPTLDIIPETTNLNFMAKKMRLDHRREDIFAERLIPHLHDYQVVLFDCNPGWTDLIENALVASNTLLMPIACETECAEALQANMDEITAFQKAMKLEWENFYMIPTLLENNTVSQNNYATYLNVYQDAIISLPIRRSVSAQEARINGVSIMEYDPKSNLAQDYFEVVTDLWNKLIN